jgi:hypothetical protein
MKKLLSICFLSILLGLLSFSTRAQSSGFWIENLQPVTLHGVANAPSGDGDLVLDNVLNPAVVGNTDLYEIHFCPNGLDPKTKVSVDWLLYRDGQLVNGNIYQYVDQFDIYTLYPELNQQGQCQSIHWLGGPVPAAFGFCDQPVQPDMFSGMSCNTPTNYPGALPVGQGTPGSVLNAIGQQVPAQGQVTVFSEGFDYFYMDFFTQTRTVVRIKWRQVGNYSLVMRIRQRNGGTASDLGWGENPELDKIGGHMSCCGEILAQDSIHYLVTGDFSKEVCENEPYSFGTITNYCQTPAQVNEHLFTQSAPDTFVLFGNYSQQHCCNHLVVDSIYNFHFFQRNTPEAIVTDTTICQCTNLTPETIINMVGYDQEDLDVADTSYLEWYRGNNRTVDLFDEGTHIYASSTYGSYLPIDAYYNHSYSQQIFTPEEIGTGTITSIAFNFLNNNFYEYDFSKHVKVYLSNTPKNEFSNSSDWDLAEKTLVFDDDVTMSESGWMELPFNQNNFEYNGENNLLVTVIADGQYRSSQFFYQTPTGGAMLSHYKFSDGPNGFAENAPLYTNENVATQSGTTNIYAYRSDVRFGIEEEGWFSEPLTYPTDTVEASYEYTVRQINVYDNFNVLDGSHKDTIVCVGDPQHFTVTIQPMQVTLSEDVEYCVADFDTTTVLTITAEHVDDCATNTHWFGVDSLGNIDTAHVLCETDNFTVTYDILANYFDFEANEDGEVHFYAAGYNNVMQCIGHEFAVYTITFHQNPVLTATVTPDSLNCPGTEAEMTVTITNNPFDVDDPFKFTWTGVDEVTAGVPVDTVVEIGVADDNNAYVPEYSLYDYSYSQQIFTNEEVPAGSISGISFNVYDNAQPRDIEIYLSTTNKNSFNLSTDWDLNEKVLVYQNTVDFQEGWNDITFDIPYEFDGNGNLLLTVNDVTGTWNNDVMHFYTTDAPGMSLVAYRDDAEYTNDNISEDLGLYDYRYVKGFRSDIRLAMTAQVEGRVPAPGAPVEYEYVLEGSGNSYTIPVNNWYNYTYTQQIYTPEEVSNGLAGIITKLAFEYAYSSPSTAKNNVDIYLTTTDKESFANNKDTISIAGLQPVYSGALNCTQGWNTFELTTPFEYDGTSNLALIVFDHSGDYDGSAYIFKTVSTNSVSRALYWYSDSYNTIASLGNNGYKNLGNFRNAITFTLSVEPEIPEVPFAHNSGYKQMSTTCHQAYESTVFVTDSNGCKSNTVIFIYEVGDTIAPVISPAAYTVYENTCDSATLAELAEANVFETIEEIDAYLKANVLPDTNETFIGAYDNCSLVSLSYEDTYTPVGDGCELQIVRVYTLIDSCDNVSTFTHTFIGHDEDAPEFAIDRPIRLIPVPAGDCKFNAPSLAVLKQTIAPFVTDECTDTAYLMSNISFVWENTNIPPADAEDIFLVQNHLTISAVMTDKCENSTDTTVVFFLDRPDSMYIQETAVEPVTLCFGENTTVTFNPQFIVDDVIAGPFTPYTYTWSEVNGRDVTFTPLLTTGNVQAAQVTFNDGAGDYDIIMTVTNSNGCTAVSTIRHFHMRPELQVSIIPDPRETAEEPYCPNLGNLNIVAVPTGEFVTIDSITWWGESVNEYSVFDTTWITIIPEWCDTTYTANVRIVDDHNCVATNSRTFTTASQNLTLAPVADVTVEISDSCKLYVPNLKDLITPDVVSDGCYTYSQIKYSDAFGTQERSDWYSQYPADSTVFTADSVLVTITVKNPCGTTATTSLYVRKPATYPTVAIAPISDSACYESVVNGEYPFVASGLYLGENPSFVWTIGTDTVGENATLTLPNDNWAPEYVTEDVTYTFMVTATNNQNNCVATATVPFDVFYQGAPVAVRIWNNTMCLEGHYNGVIAVDTVPFNYVVTVEGINVPYGPVEKINDVPYHPENPNPWNTIFFDSLQDGTYRIIVTNLHGCDMMLDTVVAKDGVTVDPAIYAVTPMTECNGNGTITITAEYGYTYKLYRDGNTNTPITGNLTYTGLNAGTYWIKKTQTATNCIGWTRVDVDDNTVNEVITATATPRLSCTTANGTITVESSVSNMQYRIVKTSNGSVKPTTASTALTHNNEALYVTSGTTGTRYYQTSNTFTGLNVGEYIVIAYNPSTECFGFDTVEVEDGRENPEIELAFTPNNYCENTSTYNGTMTVTPSTGYEYTLNWKSTGSTGDYNNPTSATSAGYYAHLYPGNKRLYQFTAKNTTTNCTTVVSDIQIENDLYYPAVDIESITANTICDPTVAPYNGGVVLDVTATGNNVGEATVQTCDYTINMHDSYGDGWNSGYLKFYQDDQLVKTVQLSDGYEGTDVVTLVSGVETNVTFYTGYVLETTFEIVSDFDNSTTLTKSSFGTSLYGYSTYTTTFTPSCGEAPAIISEQEAFNSYIQPYSVKIDGVNKGTFTDTLAAINGLAPTSHQYVVTSAYKCQVSGYVTVPHDSMPAMELTSTPNHMCVPTFQKPGDGTITVEVPTTESNPGHVYQYKFFDADTSEIDVPYELPMTTTKYWLAAGLYKVVAYEPATGCKVEDTISVLNDLYQVDFTYETTSSTFCSQTSGDGSITVFASSTNPDAEYSYSLDGENWQTSNVFTDLANKTYTVYVKDVVTGCDFNREVPISFSYCRPDITIHDQNNNTAPFEFCIDDEDITLCGEATYPSGSECEGTFTYHWNAPCSDPNSSDESCIEVVPEHVMPNGCDYTLIVTNQLTGCSYDTTVRVIVNPKPIIGFRVNGTTYYNAEQSIPFCEETPLHIEVVSMNGQTLVPEQTYWTLGHVGTGLSFDTTGVNYPDYITICAYSTSDKGCVSKIASLPLNFNRVDTVYVDTTVCDQFRIPNIYPYQYVSNPTGVYPYDTTVARTYHRTAPKCDSVVIYNITINSAPVITPLSETVAPFCEDMNYTLANFADSFAVNTNGAQTTMYWRDRTSITAWGNVDETQIVDYAYTINRYNYIRYYATNTCGTDYSNIHFTVSKAPEITNFQVPSKYCRGEQVTLPYSYTTYRPAIAVLTIGGDTVQTWTTTSNNTSTYNRSFTFTPNWANYNGKTIALSVRNLSDLCDVAAASATLTVDTNIKHLAIHAKEYCEGDEIDYDTYLPDHAGYYNVRMYIVGQYNDMYVPDGTSVPYSMDNTEVFFTMVDNVCSLNIKTDTATVTVKPLPHVALNGGEYYNVCNDDFIMPTVDKTPNGIQSLITAEGWLLWSPTQQAYVNSDAAAIKAAAADNTVYFRYFVKTNCGSDTTGIYMAHVNDVPTISQLPALTICPDNTVGSVLPSNLGINWHNMYVTSRVTKYYLVKQGLNDKEVTLTTVFSDNYQYNDGYLRVVVTNECGSASTQAQIHIPVYSHNEIVAVDTCKGMTIADFAAVPECTVDGVAITGTWMRLVNNNYEETTGDYVVNDMEVIKYRWITACGDVINTQSKTIYPLETPTVAISSNLLVNDTISICEGSTITADALITYSTHHSTVTNTEWLFDGQNFDFDHEFAASDNDKKLVVKITTTCDDAFDTVVVRVYPTPNPTISGPATACSGSQVEFTAGQGYTSYNFIINGVAQGEQPSNVFTATVYDNNPDGVDITTAKVTATDAHGCTGTSSNQVEVSVTDQAAFVFFNENGSENTAHEYTVNNGGGLNYGWMISTECSNYDTLVYVEYDIYYEGQLISNDYIGEYFYTGTYINDYGASKPYISSNTFSWFSGNGTPLSNTSYYNHAVANPNVATNGNHFPNTNLGFSHNAVYDDLWLRFLGDRQVDATLVPFRLNGDYKIVYRLYSTSHADDFEDVYTEDNIEHDNYGQQSHLGGQNGLINGAVRKMLAIDSITIHVSNVVAEPVADVPAPELAPAINTQEAVIVPEMEVWPNPAPSIITTFKARVYNMSGDATVTITNFQGKQVYNGNLYIDSDNFYFEADVNSLAVGAYIMTVRTNDAVVTKKLVVTVRQ